MVAMQAKLIEQARAGDPLAQKNLGEMRISWKEDDTNADVMEIAESLTDPGTQAEMASILKGTVVLPEPVGTPVRAVEVGEGIREAAEIAEDLRLATLGKTAAEKQDKVRERLGAIRRLREDGADLDFILNRDLSFATQDGRKRIAERKEKIRDLAESLKDGAISAEQKDFMEKTLRLDVPLGVDVVLSAGGDIESEPTIPVDEAAPVNKWQKKLDDTLVIIDGYSLGSKRQALENLRREMVKGLAPAGILKLVEEKLESPELALQTQTNLQGASERLEQVINPAFFMGNIKQQKEAALRWMRDFGGKPGVSPDDVARVQEVIDFELKLTPSQADAIRQYCLDSIFDLGMTNERSISGSFFGPQGLLATKMGIPMEQVPLLNEEVQRIVEEMSLDNFISIKNVVSEWDKLKGLEDITSARLNSSLFVPKYTELAFEGKYDKDGNRLGDNMMMLPGEAGPKNIQIEISKAMLKLKNFFDNNDYWDGYVAVAAEKKAELYKKLGLNRYVGEVAFAMLMSSLMATDTKGTSLDPFLLMVHGDTKRRKSRDVAVDREKTAQAFVQFQMANYGRKPSQDEIEVWLSKHFPSHLVPTGLSNGGDRALEAGEWLKWRVQENLYTGAQRAIDVTFETNGDEWIRIANHGFEVDGVVVKWTKAEVIAVYERKKARVVMGAKGRVAEDSVKSEAQKLLEKQKDKEWKSLIQAVTESGKVQIATDTESRIEEMKTALDLLVALKEALKPESDIDKLGALKTKCIVHWKTSMKAAGIVNEKDMIPPEFSFNGQWQSVDEWVSMTMLTACESFLHAHSVADFKNQQPWDMKKLAEKAEQVLATDVQTPEVKAYLWDGKSTEKSEPLLANKREYVNYVDHLWKNCFSVIVALANDFKPKDYPAWWGSGVHATAAIVELARKSIRAEKLDNKMVFPETYWNRAKKDLIL